MEEGFGADAADVVCGDEGIGVVEGLVEGEVLAGGAGGGDAVEDVFHERAGAEEGAGNAGGAEFFLQDVGGGDEAEAGGLFAADGGEEDGAGRPGGEDGFFEGGDAGDAVGEAGVGSQVGRDHGEDAFDAGEGSDEVVVVVGGDEFDALVFPGLRFGGVADDAADLLAVLEEGVGDGAADVSGDSHDCEHVDCSFQ